MKKAKKGKLFYKGVLDGFFETGSEGTYWVLDTGNPKDEFQGTIIIKPDDHLKVFGWDGEIVFDDKIVYDTKSGWKRYPLNPEFGQQIAMGFWVHWIQNGWKPDAWAKLFILHWFEEGRGKPQLRAELTRLKKSH